MNSVDTQEPITHVVRGSKVKSMFKNVLKKISVPQRPLREENINLRTSASLREENINLRSSASLREENINLRTSASPREENINLRTSASPREENINLRTSASPREENKNLRSSALSAGGNKKTSASPRPPREGFSLIEVVSFVVIVAISFTVLVLVFRNAGDFSMKGDLITQASQLAVHRMETIRAYSFDGIDTWDEVSTTHGSVTVTSEVYYVDPSDLETEVGGPTPLKRIVVEASAPEISTVSISSLYGQRAGVTYE
jgi:type II secretory pathway pseudopilin PulG